MTAALLACLALAEPTAEPTPGTTTDLFVQGDAPDGDEAPPPRPVTLELGQMPPKVVEAARDARGLPLPERMKAVSEPLLDAPYVADPLGEGRGIDPDPLVRYHVFDCLTFIEEVLALSLAGDPEHAAPVRLDLRYGDAKPDYTTRHHFMELQWIPSAIQRGWLVETTSDYGEVEVLEREVTMDTWRAWKRRGNFALSDEELPQGTMRLEVLPLDDALEVVDRIRPGSIVLTVREDRPWIPIWVSHVGFTVPADEPTVRHATRLKSGRRVRDHSLRWYLEHLETYTNWPAIGIGILEPVEQGPRRAAVPDSDEASSPSG